MDLFSLKGKTILITGGTGVLGKAMVKGLEKAGAEAVIALGRTQEKLDKLARFYESSSMTLYPVKADVTSKQSLNDAYDEVTAKFPKIDVLVNTAGGNMPGATIDEDQSILDLNDDDLRKVVELNYIGTVLPTQVFAKAMIPQKEGVVINISSMAAQKPLTRVMGYSSSKAAIDNYTKWLAVEMSRKYGEGFRVNAIAPGFFLTDQNRDLLNNQDGSLTKRGEAIIDHTPFGRFGEPKELVGTLIWLCSDASRFVTGTIINIDGGFSAFGGV